MHTLYSAASDKQSCIIQILLQLFSLSIFLFFICTMKKFSKSNAKGKIVYKVQLLHMFMNNIFQISNSDSIFKT